MKKTSIVMLNKIDFDRKLNELEEYYTKEVIAKRILPIEIIGLGKRGLKNLVENSRMLDGKKSHESCLNPENSSLGLYILYEGTYSVIGKQKVKLSQIGPDYFGEQMLWSDGYDFQLQAQTYEYKYLFIPKNILLEIFKSENIAKLKQLYEKKKQCRLRIEKKYMENQKFTKKFTEPSPIKKIKNRFNQKQIQQFQQILGKMAKKTIRPRWKIGQEKEQEQKIKHMKQKKIYVPKRQKSRHFSTIKEKTIDEDYHQIFHGKFKQQTEYKPKLHYHERAKTQIVFRRGPELQNLQGQQQLAKPSKTQRLRAQTSHSFYSQNYDRTYSYGMKTLSKMRKYDELKKKSTLKRGEKVLQIGELTQALHRSFNNLETVLQHSTNPKIPVTEALHKRLKQQRLLTKRLMDSQVLKTWR